jgi:hypothetical protein
MNGSSCTSTGGMADGALHGAAHAVLNQALPVYQVEWVTRCLEGQPTTAQCSGIAYSGATLHGT